jgi:hypothetical protein
MAGRVAVPLFPVLMLLCACENPLKAKLELYVEAFEEIKTKRAVYVSDLLGKDGNPGTRELPLADIQSAITRMKKMGLQGEVRVAEGTYAVEVPIELEDGISVLGGFSSSTWQRDPSSFVSTILGESTIVVVVIEDTGPGTTFGGFTVKAQSIASSQILFLSRTSAVVCDNIIEGIAYSPANICISVLDSSPHITRNVIRAGSGFNRFGITNLSSNSLIENNVIMAGTATEFSVGIDVRYSSPVIRNNVIHGGFDASSSAQTFGILCLGSSAAVIQNNTIFAGTGSLAAAVYLGDAACEVENNLLFGQGPSSGAESAAVIEANSSAPPEMLNNNAFYHCDYIYEYWNGFVWIVYAESDLALLESRLSAKGSTAAGNKAVAGAGFVDEEGLDWRLSPSSPSELKVGGKDLSSHFTTDSNGCLRTVPWSIGAYEEEP